MQLKDIEIMSEIPNIYFRNIVFNILIDELRHDNKKNKIKALKFNFNLNFKAYYIPLYRYIIII